MTRWTIALCILALFPVAAAAQEDDAPGFLEGLIERNLSSAGRKVDVSGFEGALSSNATIEELTVADEQGVWLTIRGAELDWTRSALLRGRLEVKALTADEILVPRLPETEPTPPSPEAEPFQLPEFPVSVQIDEIAAKRVVLGEPLFGERAEVSLDGSVSLAGGAGSTRLSVERIDEAEGSLTLDASYSNETNVLGLDLSLSEGPDGITANLLGIPGRPSVGLTVSGEDPLSDFAADIGLSTDGTERLAGTVSLENTPADGGGADEAKQFTADISGDLAPLVAPDYRAFFGNEVSLVARGRSLPDGRLELGQFNLEAAALSLSGTGAIAADGLPARFDVSGKLGTGTERTRLPVGGEPIFVDGATLSADFDASGGERWTLDLRANGVKRGDVAINVARIEGGGRISRGEASTPRSVTADLDYAVEGLTTGTPDLEAALGDTLSGRLEADWQTGGPVRVRRLSAVGAGLSLDAEARIAEPIQGGTVSGNAELSAEDIGRFSDLVGRELGGSARLTLSGEAALLGGGFDIELDGAGRDLRIGVDQLDRLLGGESTFSVAAARDESGTRLDHLRVRAGGLNANASGMLDTESGDLQLGASLPELGRVFPSLSGAASVDGRVTWSAGSPIQLTGLDVSAPGVDVTLTGTIDPAAEARPVTGDAELHADGLGRYAELVGRDISGDLDLTASGSVELRGDAFDLPGDLVTLPVGAFDLTLDGTAADLGLGMEKLDPLLQGEATFSVQAARDADGIRLDRFRLDADNARADASGSLTAEAGDLQATATVPRIGLIVPSVDGSASAETDMTWNKGTPVRLKTLTVSAPGVSLEASGTVDPAAETLPVSGDLTLRAEGLARYAELVGRDLSGDLDLTASGSAELRGQAFDIDLNGTLSDLGLGIAQVDRLLAGQTVLSADVARKDGSLRVGGFDLHSPQFSVTLDGQPETGLTLEARLADIGLLVSDFSGPLTVSGSVQQLEERWRTDLTANGPGGTSADMAGTVAGDGSSLDLSVQGAAPLALADTFIDPRSVEGTARFDLDIQGPPGLSAVSGTISTQGARIALPTLGTAVTGIGGTIELADGTADLSLDAQLDGTGRISMTGPIELSPPLSSDVDISIAGVEVVDPNLYETTIGGDISLSGPLLGNGLVAGTIRIGRTEIQVPSTGLGGRGDIEGLQHRDEPADVRATRRRAGLLKTEEAPAEGGGGPPLRLDLTVLAQNQIFVRGRGLDAELGGQLRLTGTAADVMPVGQFELIRGRLDILGERLTLTQGSIQLQGDFTPTIRFIAETETDDIVARIVVSGEVTQPEITFESSPELPQEEVLAHLLFGRDVTSLSPLQAAQLASAVATLAGRGGGGIISNLRDQFGLADLDITTNEEGNAAVRAGRYLSKNIYTDVTIGSDGESTLNLNLDVSPSVTVKGSAGSSGESGVGVFYERDY